MSGQFAGKTVAITGAAGGIGQWLCRFFGQEGATIAALDRSDKVNALVDALGKDGVTVKAAVADIASAGSGEGRLRRLRRCPSADQQCRRLASPDAGGHRPDRLGGGHRVKPQRRLRLRARRTAADGRAPFRLDRQCRLGQRPFRAGRPCLQRRQGGHDLSHHVRWRKSMAAMASAPTACCRARCARRSGTSARPRIRMC